MIGLILSPRLSFCNKLSMGILTCMHELILEMKDDLIEEKLLFKIRDKKNQEQEKFLQKRFAEVSIDLSGLNVQEKEEIKL